MALEDLALFRTIPGSVVLYPSDAVSMERSVELAANYVGIVFIRGFLNIQTSNMPKTLKHLASRPATPVRFQKLFNTYMNFNLKFY